MLTEDLLSLIPILRLAWLASELRQGALEAVSELLRHLPNNTGMAFVFIQHLEPRQTSRLTEILSRITDMPVEVAADQLSKNNCSAAHPTPDGLAPLRFPKPSASLDSFSERFAMRPEKHCCGHKKPRIWK